MFGLLWPQRCFRYSWYAWRRRPRLKHSPLNSPIVAISNQIVREPMGLWVGGRNVPPIHWVQDFKPQQRSQGSWAYARGLKESPVGSLKVCLRPFKPPNPQGSVWPRLLHFGSDIQGPDGRATRINPLGWWIKRPPPLLCLLPFRGNVLPCLDFAWNLDSKGN